MSKNALKQENKMLRELSADLRVKLVLLGQKAQTVSTTPSVQYRYFCEHTKVEGELTKGEKQQQKLEEKLRVLHKVIKNLRMNMAQVVDLDGWTKEVLINNEVMVGCLYCAGPPVTWEEIVKLGSYPHVDNDTNEGTCAWRLMEKRAMKEYERLQ